MGMVRIPITPPSARHPMAVLDAPTVIGEQIVVHNPDGHHYGYRGWSEVYFEDGQDRVQVVTERAWWAYQINKTPPDTVTRWPARCAWIV